MAVGTGMVLDVSKLDKELDRLDKKLDALIKKGEKTEKAFETMFKGTSAKKLLDHLDTVQGKIVDLSKIKDPMKWDSKSLMDYIDKVNRLLRTIEKANTAQGGTPTKIIDTEALATAKKEFQAMLKEVKAAEKALDQRRTSRNQTYAGAMRYSANANTLEKERQAIENLKVARDKLKQSDADYATKLNALNEAIKRHEKNLKDATKTDKDRADEAARNAKKIADAQAKYDSISRREKYKAYTTSYEGAIRTSDRAKTLAQEIQAVKNLEAARAKLNKTDADYEKKLANINRHIKQHNDNIDKATRGAKKLREEHQSLGQAAGGLGRMLASAFSIQAIRGYINQMVKVRGEMEMQQRALQAILQNKDEADAIWQKTIELAVRSPFRIKDLVTYTKQLAAYRVEADKLYDTNKMLADVSSGLGVDMSRLILAFGQVKAANYLRGTELRQFSEAGINMLGELSKYFTELEGRAVSVGDVFERISKRMVSFSDVEEIFKRITSEGGTFYRMQEIQAETLKGQISNLKDSIDIMLNEMGKANDSTLKTMVSLTKSVVDNWRTISAIVIPIVGALITRWGIFRIVTTKNAEAIAGFAKTFGRHFGIVITQLTRGTRVAKQFAKSTGVSIMGGWTTVILAVVAALAVLIKTIQNANRVKKELETLELSGAFDASRSVAEYKRLADVVADTSKSYDEQQKALTTLKTKYADILPSHLLEAKTIKELAGNYEEAKNAIYDYVAAKTKEKQIDVIQREEGQNVQKQADDLANDIKNALAKVAPNITRSDVLPIVNKLQELIQMGNVDLFNVDETLQSLVMEFTGLEISTNAWKDSMGSVYGEMSVFDGNAAQLVVSINNLKTAMDEVTASSLNWMDSFVYQDFNKVKEGYEAQANAIGKYYDTIRKYQEQQKNGVKAGEIAVEESEMNAATDALNKIFTDANREAPKWNEIINEPFKLNEATITANKLLWAQMIDDINNMPVLPSQKGAKQNYVEALGQQMEGFGGNAKQQEVARIAQELATSMKVSLEGLDELFLKSDESISDYAKRISGTLEQYKTGIKEFDNDVANSTKLGDYTKEQVDLMKTQVPFLTEFLKLFEAFLDPKMVGGSSTDTFSPMLRSIKEIYDEFKRLKATFDEVTAKEGAIAKFGNAFKEAFGKTPEEMGFDLFSEDGVKAAYDYLISKAPDAKARMQAKLAKGEITWDVNLKTKKDADKRLLDDIQNMFDQYDLSVELKKLNISPDLAKSLFGIESINLSDIREKVQGELDSAKAAGGQEDRVAQLEKDLEKINDMEDKAQVERLKTYLQYTRSAIGERAKIKVEEMNKLMEIEETFNKASAKAKTEEDKKRIEEQRKLAIAGVQKESSDKTHELDWDAFRSSETFVTMFEDLDRASDELLNHAITKIKEFQDQWADMPISDAKEMIDKLNELEMALLDTGRPFEDYRKANQEIENAMLARQIKPDAKSGKSQQALREDIGAENKAMEDMIANSERVVALLEIINNANAETKQAELEKLGINQEYVESLGLSADVLTNSAEANNEIIRDEKQKAKDAQRNIGLNQKVLNQLNKQKDRLNEQADAIGKAQQMANDLYEAFSELAEALGADSDSPAAIFADMGMNMLNTVLNTIQLQLQLHAATIAAQGLGVAMNAAMGVVGWIVMAVQLLAQVITAIVQANDKKIDAQVERLRAQVEELEKKYDKLADTIDEVYSTAALEETSRKLDEIYYKEQRALRQAIAVRKADKNISDDELDEIAEMEEQLLELEEKHAESMKEIISNATDGILDSVKDAARDFTDAWYDAFVETGKGISGLEENFSDMFMNLAKQQAAMQITQAFVDKWKRDLSKYVNEKDTELTPEDAAAWANDVKATFPELSNALEAFLGTIHETVGGLQSSGELSALQKGIQGITEDTAQIIEAYLNSIRGYVSEQVTHTRNIYNILKQATTSDAAAIRVRMVE